MTAAERMRKTRERRRKGVMRVVLAISADVRAALGEFGWLKPGGSPLDTTNALIDLLNEALDQELRPPPIEVPR